MLIVVKLLHASTYPLRSERSNHHSLGFKKSEMASRYFNFQCLHPYDGHDFCLGMDRSLFFGCTFRWHLTQTPQYSLTGLLIVWSLQGWFGLSTAAHSFHIGSGQKWSGKSLYIEIFQTAFLFHVILPWFWVLPLSWINFSPGFSLANRIDHIAGALALLAAGIPAIIYISKGSSDGKTRRNHGHHHRHNRNGELKKHKSWLKNCFLDPAKLLILRYC